MSDWWPIIAVFWILYLGDGTVFSRRIQFSLGLGLLPWSPKLHRGTLHWLAPWPWAWRILASDPVFSFSPQGICNLPCGEAGRPGVERPRPQAYRWEEIRSIAQKNRRIIINGTEFCPVSPLLDAATLGALCEKLRPLDHAKRGKVLLSIQRTWLSPLRLRRQHRLWLSRSRDLVFTNSLLFIFCIALSAYALMDWSLYFNPYTLRRVNLLIPNILLTLLVLHLWAFVQAFLLRKKQPPYSKKLSIDQWFTPLLLPAQALKLRHFLAQAWQAPTLPLSLALALGNKDCIREQAFNLLSDLKWPLASPLSTPLLALEIRNWQSARLLDEIPPLLRAQGVDTEKLFQRPLPDTASSCAYCPRCHDQFTSTEGRCPRGVASIPFSSPQSGTRIKKK